MKFTDVNIFCISVITWLFIPSESVVIPSGAASQFIIFESNKSNGCHSKSEQDSTKETPSIKVTSWVWIWAWSSCRSFSRSWRWCGSRCYWRSCWGSSSCHRSRFSCRRTSCSCSCGGDCSCSCVIWWTCSWDDGRHVWFSPRLTFWSVPGNSNWSCITGGIFISSCYTRLGSILVGDKHTASRSCDTSITIISECFTTIISGRFSRIHICLCSWQAVTKLKEAEKQANKQSFPQTPALFHVCNFDKTWQYQISLFTTYNNVLCEIRSDHLL